MAYKQVDIEDIAALVALPVFAGIDLNVFTFAVDVFGGYSFGEPLFGLAGMDVTSDVLDKHYDRRTKREKMEQRKEYL